MALTMEMMVFPIMLGEAHNTTPMKQEKSLVVITLLMFQVLQFEI